MKNAINHHGTWLMPGSTAHRLHTEGKTKELATHMREVDQKYQQMTGAQNGKA